jgi:hypothetical protein
MNTQIAKLLNQAARHGVKDDNLLEVIRDYFISPVEVSVYGC